MAILTVYTKLLDKTLDGARVIDMGSTKSCKCFVLPHDTIKWMMSRDKLYNRFIAFNKRIVIISFILSLFSYLIGYADFQTIKSMLSPQIVQIVKTVIIGIFCGLLAWFVVDTFQFTRLFYVLIRKTEKE